MMSGNQNPPNPQPARLQLAPEPRRDELSGERLSPNRDREVGAIVADVWENAEKLVRQELELGLAEIDRRVQKLKLATASAAIGGAVLYGGVLVLLAAMVLGLSNVMAPWLAALIVGVVVTGIGAAMSGLGKKKATEAVESDEHLHRTTEAMKEIAK